METGNIKEKRIKREIANSNERRRMQSINAGFLKLKRLLPVNDGEKISKANILQHAADFITTIERDRIALYEQNTLIKRILLDIKADKLDISTALATIDTAIANKALPTIPLNPHVTASSTASSTPASTPAPSPSFGAVSATVIATITASNSTATIKTKTNNIDNNIHTKGTRKYQRRQPTRSKNSNTSTASNNKRNAGKRKHNDTTTINNSANIINNNNNNNINNNNNNHNINNIIASDNIQNIGSVAEIISDKKTSPKNGPYITGGGIAKAAIALPLEVPYTSEIITKNHRVKHESDTATTVASTTSAVDSHEPASKGQTLDTICKAIMEIEGDRVFNSAAP